MRTCVCAVSDDATAEDDDNDLPPCTKVANMMGLLLARFTMKWVTSHRQNGCLANLNRRRRFADVKENIETCVNIIEEKY